MYNQVAITLDIDWAPDFVIDSVADQILQAGVRATWFVTHDSPAIRNLHCRSDLFEIGIHPNFLPNSSHGSNPLEVIRYCTNLVPKAASMRTHALIQSTPLLSEIITNSSVRIDSSLYMPHAREVCVVEHWWSGKKILRVPHIWQDDAEMERPHPCWSAPELLEAGEGMAVFDFHPIHIFLNSANVDAYRKLKRRVPSLSNAVPEDTRDLIQSGPGAGTMFSELLHRARDAANSNRMIDVESRWYGATVASKKDVA